MADFILVIHFLYLLGVVIPVPLILLGRRRGWRFMRKFWFRRIHLVMVLAGAVPVPLGRLCALTVLERRFRELSGETGPGESFISYWIGRLLYYDFPPWIFSVLYILFGFLVVFLYVRIPPSEGGKNAC